MPIVGPMCTLTLALPSFSAQSQPTSTAKIVNLPKMGSQPLFEEPFLRICCRPVGVFGERVSKCEVDL